jgi:hypothetical protein
MSYRLDNQDDREFLAYKINEEGVEDLFVNYTSPESIEDDDLAMAGRTFLLAWAAFIRIASARGLDIEQSFRDDARRILAGER